MSLMQDRHRHRQTLHWSAPGNAAKFAEVPERGLITCPNNSRAGSLFLA